MSISSFLRKRSTLSLLRFSSEILGKLPHKGDSLPEVIAKGSTDAPSFFLDEAGPHFLGDDAVRAARRNGVAASPASMWCAAYLPTRDEIAGPGLARAAAPAVQEVRPPAPTAAPHHQIAADPQPERHGENQAIAAP